MFVPGQVSSVYTELVEDLDARSPVSPPTKGWTFHPTNDLSIVLNGQKKGKGSVDKGIGKPLGPTGQPT